MTRDDWLAVLARIVPRAPLDLDAPAARSNRLRPAIRMGNILALPSARLWQRADPAAACLGVRVTRKPDDVAPIALRLASAALERGITPIILSVLPKSGFEQFGFRVERMPAEPDEERQRAEAELARFWDLTIIIDVEDIALLG